MSTFLFDEHIFGPINSRRLGFSLGINLLSTSHKVCNFDCVYCECGFTEDLNNIQDKFVDPLLLIAELEKRLSSGEIEQIDAITFAGNGEPTLHPHFTEIVEVIKNLRDRFYPSAKIVLLTNGTTLHKNAVQQALSMIDINAIKLDAGNIDQINEIDRPVGKLNYDNFIATIKALTTKFTIQTMFLKGMIKGNQFDNTTDESINNWLNVIEELQPEEVMIYSIARDTPMDSLEAVSSNTLSKIARRVEDLGIKTIVT